MSTINVTVRVEQARGAVFDHDCKPFLRIRKLLAQDIGRKICEEHVSRPEIVIGLAFVVEILEANEDRSADLCLIGAAAYENSSTRLRLQEARANNRGICAHGLVLKGADEVACPGFNGRS